MYSLSSSSLDRATVAWNRSTEMENRLPSLASPRFICVQAHTRRRGPSHDVVRDHATARVQGSLQALTLSLLTSSTNVSLRASAL